MNDLTKFYFRDSEQEYYYRALDIVKYFPKTGKKIGDKFFTRKELCTLVIANALKNFKNELLET